MKKEEYVITDGTRYIRKNISEKYQPVSNITLAEVFHNMKVATAILNNALTKTLKKSFYIAKIKDGEVIRCGQPPAESSKKTTRKRSTKTYSFDYDIYQDPNVTRWLNRLNGLKDLFDDADKRYAELVPLLSDMDAGKEDVIHFFEDKTLNAVMGYKSYYMAHTFFKTRRSLKNELKIIQIIKKYGRLKKEMGESFQELDAILNQQYRPRVLSDLFENNNFNWNEMLSEENEKYEENKAAF